MSSVSTDPRSLQQGADATRPRAAVVIEAGRSDRPASRVFNRTNAERLLSVLSPIILLVIWEVAAIVGKVDTRFFPAPSDVFRAAGQLIQSGELWTNLQISLVRIAVGFVIGAVPGIVTGLLMGIL